MKIYKKIGLGLGIVIAVLCFTLLKSPGRALAFDAQSQSDIQALIGTLAFQDRTTITGTINGTKISFVDNDITDGTYNYKPPDGSFCKTGGSINGITLTGSPFASGTTTVSATVDLDYSPDGTAGSCTDTKPNKLNATIGQAANRLTTFSWNGNDLTKLTSGDTFSHTADAVLFEKDTADNCGGGDIVILNDGSTTSGTEYVLSKSAFGPSGTPLKKFSNSHFTNSTCYLLSSQAVTVSGTQGSTSGGGGAGGTQDGTQPDTCELSSKGFSLAWLMCPLLLAGEEISNNLINAFENELSFNVNQDLGNKNSQASVEKTWSLFKNIATAILVILMLLMVFSQAISAGPFDAYTVRKMLPRLVVVAIAIQLSWPLISFVIDTFDDIGRGIANLMYFSFGGADALSLGHILNNANIGTATAATIDWVALVGAIGLGIAALPALLLLLLATGAAILTAVITLVLRKIIIILLLMMAPIALLAYVLPGTQRYWKLWIDNLIKILAMFPLVVALVAAGRIFAFIVGTQDNTQFLNFIFICIGFFGPLFFLPKTFRWGGQLMSATASGVANATNRFIGKESALGKGVQGYGERKQGEWAKAYNPNEKSTFKRGFQRLQSGHAIPFSKRSQRLAIASGDKWSQERDEEALALIKRKGEKVMREGYEAAVLTDDKTGFAKFMTDAQGNRLGKDGRTIAYTYAGKDQNGKDFYKVAGTDEIATNFDNAGKERVDTYDQADKRTMTGVSAMKQMWVDLADEGRDKHERKMAIRQLTATSSWPELQGNLSRRGNKAIDVEDWSDSITTSPEDYPRVLRSRVDATPHIDRGARDKLAAAKVSGRTFDTPQQEKDFISANRVSYGIADQMSNEDFQTQSEGFWQETSRVANLKDSKFVSAENPEGYTPEAIEVRDSLKARFTAIREIGGTAPQQLLGHLVGGSIEQRVNEALGPNDEIRNYINSAQGKAPTGQQSPPSGTNPPPQQGTTSPPPTQDDGGLDIQHDEENPPPNQP